MVALLDIAADVIHVEMGRLHWGACIASICTGMSHWMISLETEHHNPPLWQHITALQ